METNINVKLKLRVTLNSFSKNVCIKEKKVRKLTRIGLVTYDFTLIFFVLKIYPQNYNHFYFGTLNITNAPV